MDTAEMAKPSLSSVQKAALVALSQCEISQQKIDKYLWTVTLNSVEYSAATIESLIKRGAVKKIRTQKALGIPAHYTLTELGNEWASQQPKDLEKKKYVSPWQAHKKSRGEYMIMQSALTVAGSKFRSATVYELMEFNGLLRKTSRFSSSGEEVFFRVLTEDGERFGRNIPTYHPEETEMVFHPRDIPSLLKRIGIS
ncbi:hypothetical protein K5D38_11380 [Pseudomonas cichorii]|nr:hypothetical protein [Pseudomonas cichorii]